MKSECVPIVAVFSYLTTLQSMIYVVTYIIVYFFSFAESHYFLWFTKIYLSIRQLVWQKNQSEVCIFAYFGFHLIGSNSWRCFALRKSSVLHSFWPLLDHKRWAMDSWDYPTKGSRVHTTCAGLIMVCGNIFPCFRLKVYSFILLKCVFDGPQACP